MCGTRLETDKGRALWGKTRTLYYGQPISRRTDVRTSGLLREVTLVPRLLNCDVFGGMVRSLGGAGFVEGEDLFVLEFDWRQGVVAGAQALAELTPRRAAPPASRPAPIRSVPVAAKDRVDRTV